MRAPVAEKLAELRKACDRIIQTPAKRKGFTKAQRQAVWEKYDGRCAGCDDPLQPGWQIDHILALTLNGAHEIDNWRAICGSCHAPKSKAETKAAAKIARLQDRENGTRRPRQAIPNRGFDTSKSRKFDGTIVHRSSRREA